jgi:hypothetical protein
MAPLTYKAIDLITDALIECNLIAPGEVPDSELGPWAFRQLNDLIDVWAAQRAYVYSTVFSLFTLQPNLSPHTIGPTGTFVVPQRPVRIRSATLILNGASTPTDVPLNVRDDDWWGAQQTKSITSAVPTDLYPSYDWPNASLYFWPVPTVANKVRLELWTAINQFQSIQDPIGGPGGPTTLPPAYRPALKWTLAEMLCPGGAKELHPVLQAKGKEARKAIFGNNNQSPRIATQDSGMPRSGKRGGYFNWGTGGPPGGSAR